MTDVVVVQPIATSGIGMLRAAGLRVHCAATPDLEAMRPHLAQARAVITRNHGFSAEEIAAAPRLQVIGVHGTGTDRIARHAAARRGIAVLNTPGANARSVAELALGLMLACARQLPAAEAALRSGDAGWRDRAAGIELGGRVLGLVGFGHVARALVPMAQGLGMQVCVLSAHSPPSAIAAAGAEPVADLARLCARAEVISLHGLPATTPLIDAAALERMQPGTILINTARGALIDEPALAAALQAGRLHAAGLDTTCAEPLATDSPLLSAPRLVLTPHLGGTTTDALARTGEQVARLVIAALRPEAR